MQHVADVLSAPSPPARSKGEVRLPATFPSSSDFRAMDRNERVRLLVYAERLERSTHEPGWHGGCLRRTGLAVLRALLLHFHNGTTGRTDPGLDALARASGCAKSTVVLALHRLVASGILTIRRRIGRVRRPGGFRLVQLTNAYAFRSIVAAPPAGISGPPAVETDNRRGTYSENLSPTLQRALDALGAAITERRQEV